MTYRPLDSSHANHSPLFGQRIGVALSAAKLPIEVVEASRGHCATARQIAAALNPSDMVSDRATTLGACHVTTGRTGASVFGCWISA